jgi:homopolymeric O-antigen transport system ATP-binding protein
MDVNGTELIIADSPDNYMPSGVRNAPTARSDAEVRISVHNVSKAYRLYDRPQDRLKEQLFARFGKRYRKDFWALRDVSLNVRQGEALGIIGRNGSGKSTLVQIIAGTLTPTAGEVEVHGRVTALLELGSGFNRQYTGRENVYLNGAILGFRRKEMDELFDEIVAFSEIGDFIDQPVKTYSSGMTVRLAFAVQACVKPDILIVDEALSVGDIFFQQKCHERMEKLLAGSTAVVLVSHNMGVIRKYCSQALLLESGRPLFTGDAAEAVKRYSMLQKSRGAQGILPQSLSLGGQEETIADLFVGTDQNDEIPFWPTEEVFAGFSAKTSIGEGWAHCTAVALCDANGNPCRVFQHGQKAYFYYEFEALRDLLVPCGSVALMDKKNTTVHGKASYQYQNRSFPRVPKGTRVRFRQSVALNLKPGQYTFDVALDMMDPGDYANLEFLSAHELRTRVVKLVQIHQAGAFHIIPAVEKGIVKNHFGICDLPGDCKISLYED